MHHPGLPLAARDQQRHRRSGDRQVGSDEQKKAYLPRLAEGSLIGSFALTEAGSDPAGLRTTARRDGDGWVLNGAKCSITDAPIADLFVVFARCSGADLLARRRVDALQAFLRERPARHS